MTKIYILFGVVILFVIAIKIFEEFFGGLKAEEARLPYLKKKYFLTIRERELFSFLREFYGLEYYIFPQIHIASLLYVKNGEHKWRTYFNKIIGKSVDFVVFDNKDISPVLAIELDDKTHEWESRIERDDFVNKAFKSAGIPIIHIKTDDLKNKDKLKELLKIPLPFL